MTSIHGQLDQLSAEEKRDKLRRLLEERASALEEVLPLSYGQRALWFVQQMAPRSVAYNVPFAARVRAGIDLETLREAFAEVIHRHAATRTTFGARNGDVAQIVHSDWDVAFHKIDARQWSEEELHERLLAEVYAPFDLERGPLFRATVFTRDDQEHVLTFTAHHIIGDFWSLVVLLSDLRQVYAAKRLGQEAHLAPLAMEFSDFVAAQRELIEGPRGDQLWEYWKQELSGELPTLDLPTDHPRQAKQTFPGAQKTFQLDEVFSASVKRLAQDQGTTLFMTLLAAYQVLLSRCSGQEQVLVGSPTVARPGGFDRLVGYFTNMVVLRADLSEDPAFSAFLQQVRRRVSGALDHQDFPFGLLVERLKPTREAGRTPLFQAGFVLEKSHRNAERGAASIMRGWADSSFGLPGAEMVPLPLQPREVPFELNLTVEDCGDRLIGSFEYRSDLFDESTIERLAERYRNLLESIVANPNTPVSQLTILPPQERHRLLVEWNDTAQPYPRDRCIHELFEEQVERTPDAIAVESDGHQLTYDELNSGANQLAHYLRELGVGPDVLVGVYAARSLELVVGLLGVLKAGGAYVPLDPHFPRQRIAFQLEDAQARVLLTQKHLLDALPEYAGTVVCLDRDTATITGHSSEALKPVSGPHDLAYVIYTSGSTGKPKGVMIPHRALVNFLASMQHEPGLDESDVLLSVTTPSFDIFGLELYLPLLVGGTVVLTDRETAADATLLEQKLVESRATVMQATPSTWRMLLQAGWAGRSNLKILVGGEALDAHLAGELLDCGQCLWNLYGPTETTIWSTTCRIPEDFERITIGRPIGNTQVYVLDTNLEPVPIGVPGELYLAGDGLARGYLHQPELTAEKFIANPFSSDPNSRLYKTGDLARWLPEGQLDFLGRTDHQVKIHGFRIELGEIESALSEHDDVQQAVVVPQPDSTGEHRLVAYVTEEEDQTVSVESLRETLRSRLPDYMIPSVFMTVESLPLSPNGKVDRKQLPAPDKARPKLATPYVAPRTPVEKRLSDIWQEVLQVEKVGVEDDFFDLGGGSLTVVRVIALAQEAGLDVDFDLVDPELMDEELFGPQLMFAYSTIAKLAPLLKVSEPVNMPRSV